MDFVTLKYLLYVYYTRYVSYFYGTRKRHLQAALQSGDPVSNKQIHQSHIIITYMISEISTHYGNIHFARNIHIVLTSMHFIKIYQGYFRDISPLK